MGKELNPAYEQQVIQEIRLRRKQDKIAIRWLLILLFIPILGNGLDMLLIFLRGALRAPLKKINNTFETQPHL